MDPLIEIVEGWTDRLSLQLTEDGAAFDGTGLTVSALDLVDCDGTVVTPGGTVAWLTQASGTIYYDPAAADFVATKSPYRARVLVTDGAGDKRWYPNDAPAVIVVHPRY
ncbi:MAG: hypothetical protein R2708_27840 [Vicinamibacterales bacterium]